MNKARATAFAEQLQAAIKTAPAATPNAGANQTENQPKRRTGTLSLKLAPEQQKAKADAVRPKGPGATAKPKPKPKYTADEWKRLCARNKRDIAFLARKYPKLFSKGLVKPMKVGVHTDILKDLPDGHELTPERLKTALGFHIRSFDYLTAMVADGAQRHGLEGNVVEPVDPDHQQDAQRKLKRLQRKMDGWKKAGG
ncbi:ProQ/FINO family protein [Ruegeria sp. HKCCA5426]|uniref:ProQ/FINO family protein n=1 Tax=Ruegeria sp. HKCCA5426 TaxID=2682985 RepID=UPI00148977DF|nr:ProQ/FINO family protein [Ruegeria sp. HKCCA5426]